jgi:hypothetical protein
MDGSEFDRLAKVVSVSGTRRSLVRLLGAVPLVGVLATVLGEAPDATAAKKKKKQERPPADDDHGSSHRRQRRKARHRHDPGQHKDNPTGKKPRKGKRKREDRDTGTTECVKRTCPAGFCGSQADGCGGTMECGCGATGICIDGACQPCTVPCGGGSPTECGNALQAAITAALPGATLFVCPGRYQSPPNPDPGIPTLHRGFLITGAGKTVTIVGGGQGDDPARDTILDAIATDTDRRRVMTITSGVGVVTLERLHITGGNVLGQGGGGIRHLGTTLRMRDCTVTGNSCAGGAGGIHNGIGPTGSTLEMTRCTVSDNHAINTGGPDGDGGGIFSLGTATLTDCLIADNDANNVGGGIMHRLGSTELAGTTEVRGNSAFRGGGIWVHDDTVTIGADCRVTRNTAALNNGGGINSTQFGSSVILQGPTPALIVVDNCRENCRGTVPGCDADAGPVGRTCPP